MSTRVKLPIINFRPFLSGTQKDQVEVARQVDEALRTYGSLYLANHEIPQSNIDEAFQQVRAFLASISGHKTMNGEYWPCSNIVAKAGLYESFVPCYSIGAFPDMLASDRRLCSVVNR